jgi:hypothetical protein
MKATRKTPRYLFRCWNDRGRQGQYKRDSRGYDILSGGHAGLKSTKAITPLAFHNGLSRNHIIYDLSRHELYTQVRRHLNGHVFETQPSPWAASLDVALEFARGRYEDCHISILDTLALKAQGVTVVHVPSLQFLEAGRRPLDLVTGIDWEYLAHGVIAGDCHRALPTAEFKRAFQCIGVPMRCDRKHRPPVPITAEEVAVARAVAEKYGHRFVVPMTLAILCRRDRAVVDWRTHEIPKTDLRTVAKGLRGCQIPETLCSDASVLTDIVYTTGYPQIEQMIRLLRAFGPPPWERCQRPEPVQTSVVV